MKEISCQTKMAKGGKEHAHGGTVRIVKLRVMDALRDCGLKISPWEKTIKQGGQK